MVQRFYQSTPSVAVCLSSGLREYR